MKQIVIGNDHGGIEYKNIIVKHLMAQGYEVINVGTDEYSSVDYPDIAKAVSDIVVDKVIEGIIICGTGIGISIAANKCSGIRAALCNDEYSAKMAKAHNDSNILALGQRVLGEGLMLNIVDTWLTSEFEGGRHANRVEKIMKLEEK